MMLSGSGSSDSWTEITTFGSVHTPHREPPGAGRPRLSYAGRRDFNGVSVDVPHISKVSPCLYQQPTFSNFSRTTVYVSSLLAGECSLRGVLKSVRRQLASSFRGKLSDLVFPNADRGSCRERLGDEESAEVPLRIGEFPVSGPHGRASVQL